MRIGRFIRACASLAALFALCASVLTLILFSGQAGSQPGPSVPKSTFEQPRAPNPPILIAPASDAVERAPGGIPSQIFRWEAPSAGARVDFYRLAFANADNPAAPPAPSREIAAAGAQIQSYQILPPALQPAAGAEARIRWSVRACNNERVLQKVGDEPGNCSQPVSRILVWSRRAPQTGAPPTGEPPAAGPRAFDQFLIAAISHARVRPGVTTFASPRDDRRTWTEAVLFTNPQRIDAANGPPVPQNPPLIHGLPGSSPGIGSNGRFYVLAFWGRPDNVRIDSPEVSLFVSTSQDGLNWTFPLPVFACACVSGSTRIVRDRPIPVHAATGVSVAPAGLDGSWFAAFARADGTITIVPLPIDIGGRVLMPSASVNITPTTIAGATTAVAPTLSYWGSRLVLAWRDARGDIRLLSTADGRTWPAGQLSIPAVDQHSGQPLQSEASAPFLHNASASPAQRLLLSLRATSPTGPLRVLQSLDPLGASAGARFQLTGEFPIGGGVREGSAVAGPPNTFVAVYPWLRELESELDLVHYGTLVMGPGIDRSPPQARNIKQTGTRHRVTIALGP